MGGTSVGEGGRDLWGRGEGGTSGGGRDGVLGGSWGALLKDLWGGSSHALFSAPPPALRLRGPGPQVDSAAGARLQGPGLLVSPSYQLYGWRLRRGRDLTGSCFTSANKQ